MIGRSINNYKILEKLSRSETIAVYKAVLHLVGRRNGYYQNGEDALVFRHEFGRTP